MKKRKYTKPVTPAIGEPQPDADETESQAEDRHEVATGIKYIGNRENHYDRLCGTGLKFAPGEIHAIEADIAKKLLVYTDTYAVAEIPEGAEVFGATVETNEANRNDPPLLNFHAMPDTELRDFARLHYGEPLPAHALRQTLIDRLVAFSNRPR